MLEIGVVVSTTKPHFHFCVHFVLANRLAIQLNGTATFQLRSDCGDWQPLC